MKITRENTLIILDWDDTLFPTSWVQKNGIDVYNQTNWNKYSVYFHELDQILFKLFTQLKKCGRTIIVTNALPEWVKSSSRMLNKSGLLIRDTKVVSARKIYQNIGNSMDWKKFAFNDELFEITKRTKVNNIISVGDAEYEYRALISLYRHDKKNYKLLKSIRFMKSPSHDSLVDQLNVLHGALPHICTKPAHMDMKFENFSRTNI